tara:strand:+ start:1265 stop:1519 length:255 start_codon:yes stop_codon:yes gene_type:complete
METICLEQNVVIKLKGRGRPKTIVECDNNNEYQLRYYHLNKGKKVVCECGCEIEKFQLSNHKKTKKHTLILKIKDDLKKQIQNL